MQLTRRQLTILLALVVLAVPLLSCGAPAAIVASQHQAAAQSGAMGGMQGVALPWDQIPPSAPCRIAAQFAATVQGLIYSQGGAHPEIDPRDPQTGTFYSRTGPRSYDCSGMTKVAYQRVGKDIGGDTKAQVNAGSEVPCKHTDLHGARTTCWATGDIVLWYENGSAEHVEMYLHDGIFAACLNWSEGCRVWERDPRSFPAHYVVRRIDNGCIRVVQQIVLGGSWSAYPASYTAYWGSVTYTGWRAQVLQYLFAQFPGAVATTYPGHDQVGGGVSADLWTADATKNANADNRGGASMTALANTIAANLKPLGIHYVLWNRHRNYGDGWVDFGEQGDNNDDHYSHVHITFEAQPPTTAHAFMDGGRVTRTAVDGSVVVIANQRRRQDVA